MGRVWRKNLVKANWRILANNLPLTTSLQHQLLQQSAMTEMFLLWSPMYLALLCISHYLSNPVQFCVSVQWRITVIISQHWSVLYYTAEVNGVKNSSSRGMKWLNNSRRLPAYHLTARHNGAFRSVDEHSATFKHEIPHIFIICVRNDQTVVKFQQSRRYNPGSSFLSFTWYE